MSLPLALQFSFYELIATKRMTAPERAGVQQRYVQARNAGVVRLLIREMEAMQDMAPDEVEDTWSDIEAEMDSILPFLKR